MKRATIVVPVYNEATHIGQCLESLRSQSYRDATFLILDNCSTDCSFQIIAEFCKKDDRFIGIRHPKNLGASLNSVYGYSLCDTEYVAFIGAHDYISQGLIASQVSILDANQSLSMVSGLPYTVDELGQAKPRETAVYDFKDENRAVRYAKSVAQLNDCTIFQSMFRSKYLHLFDLMKCCVLHGDHITISQLLWHGNLAYDPSEIYYRREYNANGQGENKRVERIVGTTRFALNNQDFINAYLASCQSLIKNLPNGRDQFLAWVKDTLHKRFNVSTSISAGANPE